MQDNNQPLDWPFSDPPNTMAFTTTEILSGAQPILVASHDEDGTWQFLSGSVLDVNTAKIVALHEIVELDESILKLANLQPGQRVTRTNETDEWVINAT